MISSDAGSAGIGFIILLKKKPLRGNIAMVTGEHPEKR